MVRSEAQRRADKKYREAHQKGAMINLLIEERATIDAHLSATGESINAFGRRAMLEQVKRDAARAGGGAAE